MSELSGFVYNKVHQNHVKLHVKSDTQKVLGK